jgi:hypothetical protein
MRFQLLLPLLLLAIATAAATGATEVTLTSPHTGTVALTPDQYNLRTDTCASQGCIIGTAFSTSVAGSVTRIWWYEYIAVPYLFRVHIHRQNQAGSVYAQDVTALSLGWNNVTLASQVPLIPNVAYVVLREQYAFTGSITNIWRYSSVIPPAPMAPLTNNGPVFVAANTCSYGACATITASSYYTISDATRYNNLVDITFVPAANCPTGYTSSAFNSSLCIDISGCVTPHVWDSTTDSCTLCVVSYRVSTVNIAACVPLSCVSPFTRNATTDDCDACVTTPGNTPPCGPTCAAPTLTPGFGVSWTRGTTYHSSCATVCLPGYEFADATSSTCSSVLYTVYPQPETNYTSILISDAWDCSRYLWMRLSSVTEIETDGTIRQVMNPRFNFIPELPCTSSVSAAAQTTVCQFETLQSPYNRTTGLGGGVLSVVVRKNGGPSTASYTPDGLDAMRYSFSVGWPYASSTSSLLFRMLVRSSHQLPQPIPVRAQNESDFNGLALDFIGRGGATATFGDGRVGYGTWQGGLGNPWNVASLFGNDSILVNNTISAYLRVGQMPDYDGWPEFKAVLLDPADSSKAALSSSLPPIGARSYMYNVSDPRFAQNKSQCVNVGVVDMTIPGVPFNITVNRTQTVDMSSSSSSSTGGDGTSSSTAAGGGTASTSSSTAGGGGDGSIAVVPPSSSSGAGYNATADAAASSGGGGGGISTLALVGVLAASAAGATLLGVASWVAWARWAAAATTKKTLYSAIPVGNKAAGLRLGTILPFNLDPPPRA